MFSRLFAPVQTLLQQGIYRPMFHWLKKRLPVLSSTEQVALEAGDAWWEAELFNGAPDWQKLQRLPQPTFTAEEQQFIDGPLVTLCGMLDDWQIVKQQKIPESIWQYLKQQGFWALQIPKSYGGLGFSAQAHSFIVSKIATRSLSVAVVTMVPNSLGPAELLLHYGTEEQKQHYLPRLAKGDETPCFALTGLEVGSDAGAMPDKGFVCYGEHANQRVLGIRLSFEKRYITLAPVATLLGVAFKLYDPEHLLGDKVEVGITLALIPASHPGIDIGKRHLPLDLAFPNGPVRGNDIFIPLDWIIGGVAMAGQGWRMLMECLSIGRGISLPALSTGVSQLCYRTTGAYAAIRAQFKQPIGKFEGVMQALARIGGLTYMIEATRRLNATAVDQQVKPTIASAIAKYHLTEFARQIINDAMDVHGGRGIQNGPRNYLMTPYIGILMGITVEGANILTRNLMIFGQGAIRCHRYLKHEIYCLSQPEVAENLQQFGKTLRQHIGMTLKNKWRAWLGGLTGGWSCSQRGVPTYLAYYYRQMNRMSAAFAYVMDLTLLLLGGNLKRKEFLSARLADVISYLYLMSAVIKHHQQDLLANETQPYAEWALQYCLAKLQQAFDEFFANFPHRLLGKMLRWLVFPWGIAYRMPSDQLSQQIAESMLVPSPLRDHLSPVCYISTDDQDAVGRVENALLLRQASVVIEQKLKTAMQNGKISHHAIITKATIEQAHQENILSAEEVHLWQQYEAARLDTIRVDEF